MDDVLRKAIDTRINQSDFEDQFVKSFRKALGIKPTIDKIDGGFVHAHGELWALDAVNWLMWYNGTDWIVVDDDMLDQLC